MSRRVTIVFERTFGDRLAELVMRMPVWIVESNANRAAAAEAWNRATEWPHISVTLFRPPDDLRHLLSQIGRTKRVEVIGMTLTDDARDALVAAGFGKIVETSDGFHASMSSRANV